MKIVFGNKDLLKNESIDKLLCSLYLFILIFAPPIIPYPHILLTIISLLILIIKYKNYIWRILEESQIKTFMATIVLLIIYILYIPIPISVLYGDIVNASHYISLMNRYGVFITTVSICTIYILCKTEKYNYEFILKCLINAGLIEGFCSILAFFSPTIKELFIFFMQRFSESYLYSNTWYITVRSYGFASTLVDLFGVGIGIIAGISFIYGVIKEKKYIIKSVFISAAALLNSRTGLIIYFIAIILTIFLAIVSKEIKNILKILISSLFLIFCGMEVFELMSSNEDTYKWFQSGFESIFDFFSKNNNYNSANDPMSLLFQNKFWVLPDFPRILIGTGHTLYLASGYAHSDVGYINEIWLFGVFGCIVLYGVFIKTCLNIIKRTNDRLVKYITYFLFIAFFFFNIKGELLGYNPGASALFFVLFSETFYLQKERNIDSDE